MAITSLLILAIQISFSLVIFTFLGIWYGSPLLGELKTRVALTWLLWIHVFRYLPLVLLATDQIDPHLPDNVAEIIAIGDFVSAALALIAIILLRYNIRGSIAFLWVFLVVSTFDMIIALFLGLSAEVYKYELGVNWYILTVYVPLLLVSKILMIQILLKRPKT